MEHDQHAHVQPRDNVLAHPLDVVRRKAAELHEIRDAGESPVTLLVVAAEVVSFLAPIVAFVMFLAFAAAHYAA